MKRQYRSFDFLLVLLVCAVAIFGIVILGSASKNITIADMPVDFGAKQRTWFVIGFVVMLAAAFVDYHFICKFFIAIYGANLLLLAAAIVVGGNDGTDTTRWINIAGFTLQPSEFTKLFMVIFWRGSWKNIRSV